MNHYKSRQDNRLLQEAYETEVAAQPLEEGSREFNPAKFAKQMQGLTRYATATDSGELALSSGAYLSIKGILQMYHMDVSARKQALKIANRTFLHLDNESRNKLQELIQARTLAADDKWVRKNQPYGGDTADDEYNQPGHRHGMGLTSAGARSLGPTRHAAGVTVRDNYGV